VQIIRAGEGAGALRRRSRCAAVPVALAVAACLTAAIPQAQAVSAPEQCPPQLTNAAAPAAPVLQPPAAEILVCVAGLSITGAEYTHWAEVARKDEGASPKHPASNQEIEKEVLGFLISSDWTLEQARALHIHVSDREVHREFERIRAQQFPKHGEFGAFLEQTGQTGADLLFRVKLNMISNRLLARVGARQHGTRARERALARFVKGFKQRWQARTYCAPEYADPDCGHVVNVPL
jgi:hypothetical protein